MKKLALLGGKPLFKKKLPAYQAIGSEEKKAIAALMEEKILSGYVGRWGEKFFGGKYVKKLENDFSRYFKVKHAIAFNSATTALQAAVAALGIGPGDEVITTPYTMSATASAILFNNALPVFADIDENTFCIDPKSIEKKITKRTKAIMAVNLFGRAADYKAILKVARTHKLYLIEDNAQAAGATLGKKFTGSVGDIGVFSLNSNKVIHSGEGGVLVTDNEQYALRSRLMMNHGEAVVNDLYKQKRQFYPILGNNYRMTELQAVVAIEQLKKLKMLNQQRIVLANYLTKSIKRFNWLLPPVLEKNNRHVYFTYPMRFSPERIGIKRSTFVNAMRKEGFPLVEGYQEPIYLFPIYQKKQIYQNSRFPFFSKEFKSKVNYQKGICPVAERMYEEELLLTNMCMRPQTKRVIDLFVAALTKIEQNKEALKNYEKNK